MARGVWKPTEVLWFKRTVDSSTSVAHVETDAGPAYLKALGNPEGPHALVRELIGVQVAETLGLPTFDWALLTIGEIDEIPLTDGTYAEPGPAFVTRHCPGEPWNGDRKQLRALGNPGDITRLMMLDTFLLNADRCPPDGMERNPNRDNVFLSWMGRPSEKPRLVAMDFTHCLGGGRELGAWLKRIDCVKDDRVYGCFPAFREFLKIEVRDAVLEALKHLHSNTVDDMVKAVPREWQCDESTRLAVGEFLKRRANFMVGHLEQIGFPFPPQQGMLGGGR